MTTEAFYRKLEETLEIPAGSIKGNEELASLQGWDSLGVLSFIAMADSVLSISVPASDLQDAKTVADLARLAQIDAKA